MKLQPLETRVKTFHTFSYENLLRLCQKHIWGITAIIAGFSFRLLLYCWNDSLFRDESTLLLDIINRSFTHLIIGGDDCLIAPFPFLWALRLVYIIVGSSEFYFRLIPLMAGISSLVLYYFLACKTLKNRYGIIASTWVFAVAYNEILYSVLIKQYSLDVLVATILIYVSSLIITKPLRLQAFLRFTLIGIIAVLISYPAIFIIGGISIGLFVNFRKIHIKYTIFFTGITSLTFLISYLYVIRNQTSPFTYSLFEGAFAPHTFGLWHLKAALLPFDGILGRIRYLQPLLLIICIIGLNYIRKREIVWACTLIFPLILVFIASGLHKYPFTPRLLLFITPNLLLLFGYGVGALCGTLQGKLRFSLLIILIIVPYAIVAITSFNRPCGGVREALQYVEEKKKPGDVMLVDIFAAPTVRFYQSRGLGFEPALNEVIYEWFYLSSLHNAPPVEALISSIPKNKRIWFIAEASGYARRYDIGFLRKRVIGMEELLHSKRYYLDKYYTDRAFALYYSAQTNNLKKAK